MSHIDEARLHEYLDALDRAQGARSGDSSPLVPSRPDSSGYRGQREQEGHEIEQHLSECAECAALLEEVQVIRERASALLREAAPLDVPMPPFEEIEARARAVARKVPRPAPRRVFTMNRLAALGWAATIVLAVGVGWLIRGSFDFRAPESQVPQAALPRDVPATAAVVSDSADTDRGVTDEIVPAPALRMRRDAGEPAEEQAAPPAAADERLAVAEAPSPEPKRSDLLAEPGVNVAEAEQPMAAKAEPAAEHVARQAVAGVTGVQEEAGAPGRGAAPDLRAQLNEALAGAAWSLTDRSEAERRLGGELRAVEELPIDSVRMGQVGGRPAVVVSQSLPGGELLEIVQWPGDIERSPEGLVSIGAVSADQAPIAREQLEARTAVRPAEAVTSIVSRGGFVLALRARISLDSLATIATKIRP